MVSKRGEYHSIHESGVRIKNIIGHVDLNTLNSSFHFLFTIAAAQVKGR